MRIELLLKKLRPAPRPWANALLPLHL